MGTEQRRDGQTLLAPAEPPPYRVLNEDSRLPLLLLCDHASRRIPEALDNLGVDEEVQRCHLAWDIGAAALTEALAERLGATAVLAQYSRLVIDCNRQLADPQAFLEYGDGVAVPGNRGLTQEQKERRINEIFWPYHTAISGQIDRLIASGQPPVVLAIHSFTPVLDGESRPWQVGILWDSDPRVPDIIIPALREAGFAVGDNEPYSGREPQDFTIDHHAEAKALPHAGIEIRHDQISDEKGVEEIATALETLFGELPSRLADVPLPAASG